MSYQTGAPASTEALIDTFIAWLDTEAGFTLAGSERTFDSTNTWLGEAGSSGLNWTSQALSRDGQYVLLAWPTSAPNRLSLNTATANPASGRINAATGSSVNNTVIELGTSPLRYWMFADGDSAHMVVEWVGGAYQHVSVGYMQKYGAFTGGLYVTGVINNRQNTYTSGVEYYHAADTVYQGHPFGAAAVAAVISYCGHLRATYGGNTLHSFGQYTSIAGGVASNVYMKGYDGSLVDAWMMQRSPNAYNGRSLLIPVELIIGQTDSATPASWIPVGRVNNAAFINIANLNPADLILADWMVFPWSAKNFGSNRVSDGVINSLNYGMAYRK